MVHWRIIYSPLPWLSSKSSRRSFSSRRIPASFCRTSSVRLTLASRDRCFASSSSPLLASPPARHRRPRWILRPLLAFVLLLLSQVVSIRKIIIYRSQILETYLFKKLNFRKRYLFKKLDFRKERYLYLFKKLDLRKESSLCINICEESTWRFCLQRSSLIWSVSPSSARCRSFSQSQTSASVSSRPADCSRPIRSAPQAW